MDKCLAIDSVGFECVLYRTHNGPHTALIQWEDRDAFYSEDGSGKVEASYSDVVWKFEDE